MYDLLTHPVLCESSEIQRGPHNFATANCSTRLFVQNLVGDAFVGVTAFFASWYHLRMFPIYVLPHSLVDRAVLGDGDRFELDDITFCT